MPNTNSNVNLPSAQKGDATQLGNGLELLYESFPSYFLLGQNLAHGNDEIRRAEY